MTTVELLIVFGMADVVAGVTYGVIAWRRRGPDDGFRIAQLRLFLSIFMRVAHGLRWFPGPPATPVPLTGPAIVVANHRSGVDPLVLSASTRRLIHFLMAREYYEVPVLNTVCRLAGAIPVNRDGNDLGATKVALKYLRQGQVVGIFPQGGIRHEGSEDEFSGKSGAALLALRTGAPVIPACIQGTPGKESVLQAVFTPSRSVVHFGEPIYFQPSAGRKASREEIDRVAQQILDRIQELGEKAPGN